MQMLTQSQKRRLRKGRNPGTDNVLTMRRRAAMAGNFKANNAIRWLLKDFHLNHGLSFDLFDNNLRERLTMTLTFTVVALSLVLEDQNLLVLALSFNLTRYFGTFNNRLANFDITIVYYRQNFVKHYSFAFSSGELLHHDYITFSDLVLLATSFDNCVHENTSL